MTATAPPKYAVYYEGGTVDRFFVAPARLDLSGAKKHRIGKMYKTEWGARQAAQAKNAMASR